MSGALVLQCTRQACTFRFPGGAQDPSAMRCPKCGASVLEVERYPIPGAPTQPGHASGIVLEGYLDNLRSVLNVGAIFRTADGCGIRTLHLGGITPPPTHPRMEKTALGAGQLVAWEQHWDGIPFIQEKKRDGFLLLALERTQQSTDLAGFRPVSRPILLVAGNENHGIDPGILRLCDQQLHLPMAGEKESLNVAVAFSIAAYWLSFFTR